MSEYKDTSVTDVHWAGANGQAPCKPITGWDGPLHPQRKYVTCRYCRAAAYPEGLPESPHEMFGHCGDMDIHERHGECGGTAEAKPRRTPRAPSRGSGRSLRKEWKNKRSGYSRRARWYDNNAASFRINLEDEYYSVNRFFDAKEEAQKLWDAFRKVAESDIPGVIDGQTVSVVQLTLRVTVDQLLWTEPDDHRKTLGEQLNDLEHTPEFQRAYRWLQDHPSGARLPDKLEP